MSDAPVQRQEDDLTDDDYVFAGRLLGTKWEFKDGRTETVVSINRASKTEQGMTLYYPEVEFERGTKLAVSTVRGKIRADAEFGIDPVCTVAENIVQHYFRNHDDADSNAD